MKDLPDKGKSSMVEGAESDDIKSSPIITDVPANTGNSVIIGDSVVTADPVMATNRELIEDSVMNEDPMMTESSILTEDSVIAGDSLIADEELTEDSSISESTALSHVLELIESQDLSPFSFDLPAFSSLTSSNPGSPYPDYRIKECTKPCWVMLERLSEEEIQKYTSVAKPPEVVDKTTLPVRDSKCEEEQAKELARRNSRKFQTASLKKFEEYKKNRQNFLKKKRRRSSSEAAVSESTSDEYKPSETYTSKERRKKKKLTYEDDFDWSPKLDREISLSWRPSSSKHRKFDKLRVTTRRRRIETDSDSDSDFDYETYMYDSDETSGKQDNSTSSTSLNTETFEDVYDPSKTPPSSKGPKTKVSKAKKVKPADASQDTMIDNDVLSRIMQEMVDYNMKNRKGSKVVQSIFNGGSRNQTATNMKSKSSNPKRKRAGIKVTNDILPPSVCTVQSLLSNMVNTVCSIETKRLKKVGDDKKKKCKWCESLFLPQSSKDILCVICRDTIDAVSVKGLPPKLITRQKKVTGVAPNVGKTSKAKSKIMNKVLKNLPQYEQHRLIYSDKADRSAVDKGYNHLKSLSSNVEYNENQDVMGKNTVKKVGKGIKQKKKNKGGNLKLKNEENRGKKVKSQLNTSKTKPEKKLKKSADALLNVPEESEPQALPLELSGQNQKHVAVTNVNKGLFLMTFPDPDKELEIPQNNPTGKATVPLQNPPTNVSAVQSTAATNAMSNTGGSSAKILSETAFNRTANSQYSNYVMPSVPTVVVANYAASDANKGDYVLSSLFYQNELTKNSSARTGNASAATVANKPLSMPTANQLSVGDKTVPSNSYQNTYLSLPLTTTIRTTFAGNTSTPINSPIVTGNTTIRAPFAGSLTSPINGPVGDVRLQTPLTLPSNIIVKSVTPQISSISQPMLAPLHIPNTVTPANNQPLQNNVNYSVQSDITRLINRCGLQITSSMTGRTNMLNSGVGLNSSPLLSNSTSIPQTDINMLVANCGLQITPSSVDNSVFGNNTNSISLPSNPNYSTQPDMSRLMNRYGLQITPSSDSSNVMPEETFGNQDISVKDVSVNPVGVTVSRALMETESSNLNVNSYVPNMMPTEDNDSIPGAGVTNKETVTKLPPMNEKSTAQNIKESETHLEKDYIEIEAFSILGILDLEKNPKAGLQIKIEQNLKMIEELSKDESKHAEHVMALRSKEILKVAKKFFVRFGSFTRLSEHFLKEEDTSPLKTPLQIKKEFIEEEEEEMPSCQFAKSSSHPGVPQSMDIPNDLRDTLKSCEMGLQSASNLTHIEKIENQIEAIADELISSGVDCTIPIPGITAMSSNNCTVSIVPRNDLFQESRETPSRGSGPRTPARPESAASHTDERMLTPAQVKKEKMDSAISPFSQCAFAGNNSTPPVSNMSASTSMFSQPIGALSSLIPQIQVPSLPHATTQSSLQQQLSVIQTNVSQPGMAYRNSPSMSRMNVAPNVSLMPNVSYSNTLSNTSPNISIRTVQQSYGGTQVTNYLGSRYMPAVTACNTQTSYNNIQISNALNYQNQGPPNKTVPFDTNQSQNLSHVLLNVASKSINQNNSASSNPNASVIFRNGQQGVYMPQQQQQVNQVYNVQQVYLPNRTPILQQSLNSHQSTPPQSSNQYVMRQNTASNNLVGRVLLNGPSMLGNQIQQNNMYSHQNNVTANYPQEQVVQSLNTATIQQISTQNNQLSPDATAAFLMQNNKQPAASTETAVTDMFCAMCNKVATLRCKQCTKVAYCNPTCAKTFWHTKHKMECRPLDGTV